MQDAKIEALREAIESLEPHHERLREVIVALAESEDPGARKILIDAAGRAFDNLEGVAEARKKRATGWPTLAEIFREDDYFLHALHLALDAEVELDGEAADAVRDLARRTLKEVRYLSVIGTAWARAMRVVARFEMEDQVYVARGYVTTFRDSIDRRNTQSLSSEVITNLAESAITFARLDPENAGVILRDMFGSYYRNPEYRADVVSALLAGLLVLEPEAPDVLAWVEQFLTLEDDRPIRAYGALAGIASQKLEATRDWVDGWLQRSPAISGVLMSDVADRVQRAFALAAEGR